MQIDNLRLGQQSRDQLIRLKRLTGIDNWNVLCRWAMCLSLADRNPPPRSKSGGEAVEISWKTLAGEQSDIYLALLIHRARDEAQPVTREGLSELVRLHVTRGIGLLTAQRHLAGISGLFKIVE
jgi:DNA sulfur modification protein DndE